MTGDGPGPCWAVAPNEEENEEEEDKKFMNFLRN